MSSLSGAQFEADYTAPTAEAAGGRDAALLRQAQNGDRSAYGQIVREHSMSFDERAILILALAPYIRPQLLDSFLIKHTALDRGFTEFGGTIAGARCDRLRVGARGRHYLGHRAAG